MKLTLFSLLPRIFSRMHKHRNTIFCYNCSENEIKESLDKSIKTALAKVPSNELFSAKGRHLASISIPDSAYTIQNAIIELITEKIMTDINDYIYPKR